MLAGLQEEVKGLAETVQRQSSENEDTQESVDSRSRQDSDDGERSRAAGQADSHQQC